MKNISYLEQSIIKIQTTMTKLSLEHSNAFNKTLLSLKDMIVLSDPNHKEVLCYEFLDNNILELILQIANKERRNKELILKGGEFLLLLFSSITKSINRQIKNKWKEFKLKHDWMTIVSEILKIISESDEKILLLYFKIYLMVIKWELQIFNEPINFNKHISLLCRYFKKYNDKDNIFNCIISIIMKIVQNKSFKAFIIKNQKNIINNNSIVSLPSENNDAMFAIKSLVHILVMNASESKCKRNTLNIIECIKSLLNNTDCAEIIIRNESLITSFANILNHYPNDLIIEIEARELLIQIFNNNDILLLIELIKLSSINNLKEINNQKIFQNVQSFFSFEDINKDFRNLKRNTMSIILLLLKDLNILNMMKESKVLESLVIIFKTIVPTDADNAENMTIVLTIILQLANAYNNTFDINYNKGTISMNLQQEILQCCCISVSKINDDCKLFNEVLEYFKNYSYNNTLINNNQPESLEFFFITLLNKYHNQLWLYTCLHDISVSLSFTTSQLELDDKCKDLFLIIEDSQSGKGLTRYKISNIIYMMNSITLALSLNNSHVFIDEILEVNPSHTIMHIFNKITHLIFNDSNHVFDQIEVIDQFIPLLFTALENAMSNQEITNSELLIIIFKLLTKIRLGTNDPGIISHLIMRLSKIYDLEMKEYNLIIFCSDRMALFAIYCLSWVPKYNNSIAEGILKLIYMILNSSINNKRKVSSFFLHNGYLKLLKLITKPPHQTDSIIYLYMTILQMIQSNYVLELSEVYQNDLLLIQLIYQLQKIHFLNKNLSESCYYEIMSLFELMIFKTNLNKNISETTDILDYFIKEVIDIFYNKTDINSRIIIITFHIMTHITTSFIKVDSIIPYDLFWLIDLILNEMIKNNDQQIINSSLFIDIIDILSTLNNNTIEYCYNQASFRGIIKSIMFLFSQSNSAINCSTIDSCLQLFKTWTFIDVNTVSLRTKEVLFPISYFKELILIFPKNNNKIKDSIEILIQILETYQLSQNHINEEFIELEKDLCQLLKVNNNNSLAKDNKTMTDVCIAEKYNLNDIKPTEIRRKSAINIATNAKLIIHFDTVVSNIKQLIVSGNQRFSKGKSIDKICIRLVKLIEILKLFCKDEENAQMIYDSNIIDLLINIIESDIFLAFTKNEVYLLLNDAIETYFDNNSFIQNSHACSYFIKEFGLIHTNYDINKTVLLYNKIALVSKVIANLSNEQSFISKKEYKDIFNIKYLIDSLYHIQADISIIMNLLNITNNLVQFKSSNAILYIKDNIDIFCDLMMNNIWKNNKTQFRSIELLLQIFKSIKEEEVIINRLFDLHLKEMVNEVLGLEIDSTLLNNIIGFIDCLIVENQSFVPLILDDKVIQSIIKRANDNLFNITIIQSFLSIFSHATWNFDPLFISTIGFFGVNSFCITVIEKYMTTSHHDIITTTLRLIKLIMSNDSNFNEFSLIENVKVIQRLLIHNFSDESLFIEIGALLLSLIKDKPTKKQNHELNYDLAMMTQMINQSMIYYNTNTFILKFICKMLNTLIQQTKEPNTKQIFIKSMIDLLNTYLPSGLLDYIAIVLKSMNDLLKNDQLELYGKTLDCIIDKTTNILSKENSHSKNIYDYSIDIIKSIVNSAQATIKFNCNNILPIMKLCLSMIKYHDNNNLLMISDILCFLPKTGICELPLDFLMFFLIYLNNLQPQNISSIHYHNKLENLMRVADYYYISTINDASEIIKLLVSLFKANCVKEDNLVNVFMIISKLALHSDIFKQQINNTGIEEITAVFNSLNSTKSLLQYHAKLCFNNLKIVQKTIDFSQPKINIKQINRTRIELNNELTTFLKVPNECDLFTDEGEKVKVLIKMNDELQLIEAIENNITIYWMKVAEMDSCIRSGSTPAFTKSVNMFSFFSKKPSMNKCFTIIGIKELNKTHKSLNLQCRTEEDCIKYVDSLSILINNK